MPSTSKPQAILMAMAAKNPQLARARGIPVPVAKDFNRADQRTGILKRGAGGSTPKESGMNAKMNFGQGHGHSMFSTMPILGHAMSGTQLGQGFADGGGVKKPAGPSASERKEIRALIERGKEDALSALRATRASLVQSMPPRESATPEPPDYAAQLASLGQRLANGGQVKKQAAQADPRLMYQEYTELLDELENNENSDPHLHMQIVDRLAVLEDQLGALGIPLT